MARKFSELGRGRKLLGRSPPPPRVRSITPAMGRPAMETLCPAVTYKYPSQDVRHQGKRRGE